MKKNKNLKFNVWFIFAFLIINMLLISNIFAEAIDIKPVQYMNKVVCANLGEVLNDSGLSDVTIPIGVIETKNGGQRRDLGTIYNLFYGMPMDGTAIAADKDYGIYYCDGAVNKAWFGDGDAQNYAWRHVAYTPIDPSQGNSYRVIYSNPTAQIFFSKLGIAKREGAIPADIKQYLIYEPHINELAELAYLSSQIIEINNNVQRYKDTWHYAEEECNKYCNSCKDVNFAYVCYDYELKDNYYALANYSQNNPARERYYGELDFVGSVNFKVSNFNRYSIDIVPTGTRTFYASSNAGLGIIAESTDEKQTVLKAPHKCMNLLYNNSEIGGTRRYWFCEDRINCTDSCEGTCITPKDFNSSSNTLVGAVENTSSRPGLTTQFKLQSYLDIQKSLQKDAFVCFGTKKKNVVFPDGTSTEDAKYYTDDLQVISNMYAFKGDNIEASLGNIYQVGTGQITCEGVFNGDFANILRDVLKYVRIAAVGIFVIFTTLDFIKAISGEDNQINAAKKNLTKRFIILLILLILPTLINVVLSIVEIKNGLCFLN